MELQIFEHFSLYYFAKYLRSLDRFPLHFFFCCCMVRANKAISQVNSDSIKSTYEQQKTRFFTFIRNMFQEAQKYFLVTNITWILKSILVYTFIYSHHHECKKNMFRAFARQRRVWRWRMREKEMFDVNKRLTCSSF